MSTPVTNQSLHNLISIVFSGVHITVGITSDFNLQIWISKILSSKSISAQKSRLSKPPCTRDLRMGASRGPWCSHITCRTHKYELTEKQFSVQDLLLKGIFLIERSIFWNHCGGAPNDVTSVPFGWDPLCTRALCNGCCTFPCLVQGFHTGWG